MGDFCVICGVFRDDHPSPIPGPPDPPPERYEGVWRSAHAFSPSDFTLAELLDERDGQIHLWRKRAYTAERKLQSIKKVVEDQDG